MSESNNQFFLVYDGDCPLCVSSIGFLTKLRIVKPELTKPFRSFEPSHRDKLLEGGIKNQILAYNQITGETTKGIDAFLIANRISGGKSHKLLEFAPIKLILGYFYPIIAYNRRILAPIPNEIVCDCDPEENPKYRSLLIVVLVIFILLISGLLSKFIFASSIKHFIALLISAFISTSLPLMASSLIENVSRTIYKVNLLITLFIQLLFLLLGASVLIVLSINNHYLWISLIILMIIIGMKSQFKIIKIQNINKIFLLYWLASNIGAFWFFGRLITS